MPKGIYFRTDKTMEIIKKPQPKYNPLNLPKVLDFHLATKDLPLPKEVKTHIQVALSKMDRTKLKRLVKDLKEMRYDALGKQNYKMAAYCESVGEFTEEYLKSVIAQNRV